MTTYYVSVTGLRLRGWWPRLRFWLHAIPAMAQARGSGGNIFADLRIRSGVHHTLTVWENEAAMKRFLHRGAHRKAVQAFSTIATGMTCGFLREYAPGWDEALETWTQCARDYCPSVLSDKEPAEPGVEVLRC